MNLRVCPVYELYLIFEAIYGVPSIVLYRLYPFSILGGLRLRCLDITEAGLIRSRIAPACSIPQEITCHWSSRRPDDWLRIPQQFCESARCLSESKR